MALTRANVESILIRRVGQLLALVGLDGTTVNGSNADLNDPIGAAIRDLAFVTDDPSTIDNDDVARVSADYYNQFLDLVELRTLETVLGNWDLANIRVGPHDEELGDLYEATIKRVEAKRKAMQAQYGTGTATLSTGVIGLGFQEQNPASDL